MNRTALSLTLALVPLAWAVGVFAQDKTKKPGRERLQQYWGQLELDEKQRDAYDRVAREYGPKIEKLEAELDALKEKRKKEWQKILSPAQKSKLESILATRGKNKPKPGADDDKDGGDEPTTKKKTNKKPDAEETEDEKPSTKKKSSKKDKP